MDGSEKKAETKGGRGWIAAAVAAVVLAGGTGAVLYARDGGFQTPFRGEAAAAPSDYARFAKGEMGKLDTSVAERAPETPFNDADGKPTRLDAVQGEITVVNLWATWCGPCVVEMPTLAALDQAYAGKGLKVVPISLDRPVDLPDAKNFVDVHDLPLYHDPKFALPSALGVKGLPATIVYRDGREVARLTGGADWNSREARALFDALLAEPAA